MRLVAASSASRDSRTWSASIDGRRCWSGWKACSRRSVDEGQLHRPEGLVVQGIHADLHPSGRSTEADNQEDEIAKRLSGIGLGRLRSATGVRVVSAHYREILRLRF